MTGIAFTLSDLNKYIDSLLEINSELKYHTCPQVLENNVLIWKGLDTWYCAESDRNKYGFSAHPRVITICKYCGEDLC